jgi:hypothetical protein
MVAEPIPDRDDIPYGVRIRIAQIAREFPAVQYDAADPNASAIEAYCHSLGLEPQPSDSVPPRTIRGAASQTAAPRDVTALAATLHGLICRIMPGASHRTCDEDLQMATDILGTLAIRGWRLASDPRNTWRAGG